MNSTTQAADDSISLRELIDLLWRGKWLAISLAVGLAIAGGVASVMLPKKYRATVTVAPVTSSSGGQLGGLASLATQVGLASVAGLSLSGDTKKWESLAVLQSEFLTKNYIESHDLLPVLYPKLWDAGSKSWRVSDPAEQPTLWMANELFKRKIRSVYTDSRTGMVTITIAWTDPQTAAKWANDLVRMTNEQMRNKAIAESERNIAYLNEQASTTDVVGVKQTIYKILESEINKSMLARGSDEYSLKVIDPASPPESPSTPPFLIWVTGGFLAGAFLSVAVAFARTVWR